MSTVSAVSFNPWSAPSSLIYTPHMAAWALIASLLVASAHAAESLNAGDAGCGGPRPLLHAHNDYLHRHPLFDALRLGYDSVEADVFFVDGRLLIGHTRESLDPKRTLESLYLQPLERLAKRNNGTIRPGKPHFTLLIELKTKGETTYPTLRKVLERHRNLLTSYYDGQPTYRAVTIVLTGNRPWGAVLNEHDRVVAFDGNPSFLGHGLRTSLVPWISVGWAEAQDVRDHRQELKRTIHLAHAEGRKVRVWGTPDTVATWRLLERADVDILQSNDLPALKRFARSCR